MRNPLRQLGKSYTMGQGMMSKVLKDLDETIEQGQNRLSCSKGMNELLYSKEWIEYKVGLLYNDPFTVKSETIIFDREYGNKIYLDRVGIDKNINEMDRYLIEIIDHILNKYEIKKIRMENIYDCYEYEKQETTRSILRALCPP